MSASTRDYYKPKDTIVCPRCFSPYNAGGKITFLGRKSVDCLVIKSGTVKKRQRYACKKCGRYFTEVSREKTTPAHLYRLALHLYIEGLTLRAIGDACGVSNVAILKWMKKMGITDEMKALRRVSRKSPIASKSSASLQGLVMKAMNAKGAELHASWMFIPLTDNSPVFVKTIDKNPPTNKTIES